MKENAAVKITQIVYGVRRSPLDPHTLNLCRNACNKIDCTPLKVIAKGSTRFQSMASGESAFASSTVTPTMSKFVIIIEAKNKP